MAIVKKGTLTVGTGGVAQNLALGFIPSYFRMVNKTIQSSGTVTGVTNVEWWDDMPNASSYITTSTTGSGVLSYISTNGITPYQTADSALYPTTNLTITGISKAAQAVITATHAFTAKDWGVTTVTFHNVVGMTQINTLSGVVQSSTSTTSFVVNINTTGFTTYGSGGIANIITGVPALQGGLITSGNAPGFPPAQTNTTQVLNTALFNNATIGLTLGTTLMVNTSDVWEYLALLDASFTSD
jgi:hypothetical protein